MQATFYLAILEHRIILGDRLLDSIYQVWITSYKAGSPTYYGKA